MIPALVAICLLLSAGFSAAEVACFSITAEEARGLQDVPRRRGSVLRALLERRDRTRLTILVGNTAANLAAVALSTYAAAARLGASGVAIAAGGTILLILLLGELVPRGVAASHPETVSAFAAPFLLLASRILAPVVRPLETVSRRIAPEGFGRTGLTPESPDPGSQIAGRDGRSLIERAVTLGTTRVWEVMTPRVDIFAWPADRRLSEVEAELSGVPYSRIPVYEESLDRVTGVLYLRDVFQALLAGRRDVLLGSLAREPLFVPSSVSLLQLLRDFQARRIHLGLVVDEHGGIDGLVTLEDILEELVGEIVDETDIPEEPILRVHRNEILVAGSVDLREINHFFNTSLPLLEHRTLNGFLLEELGRVPDPGEVLEREGVRIEVLEATDTQVTRARLTRIPPHARGESLDAPREDAGEVQDGGPAAPAAGKDAAGALTPEQGFSEG